MAFALLAVGLPSLACGQSSSDFANREEWWILNDDGCSLYVTEYGEGDTVVIIHGGFGGEYSYLLDAFSGFESNYHLVFYDQRGSLRSPYNVYDNGGSDQCPDSLISLDAHVEDLEHLRTELGLDQLTIVAHSMGTFIAMSYLEKYPDRVKGLVLVSPGLPPRPVTDETLKKQQREAANSLFMRPEIEPPSNLSSSPGRGSLLRSASGAEKFSP